LSTGQVLTTYESFLVRNHNFLDEKHIFERQISLEF